MLGKLLKYELRATAHTMLPIFGVMLLAAGLTNVAGRLTNGRELPAVISILLVLVVIIFGVGVMAIGLVTVFMMVQRFRDNLLRDEGYIMHTLPTSVHALIWSKVIVSALWYTLTGITVVLSIMLAVMDVSFINALRDVLTSFVKLLGEDIRNVEILIELIALLVMGSVVASLGFDAALSVGHSFANRKMLVSVLTFIGLMILGQTAAAGVTELLGELDILEDLVDVLVNERMGGFMAAWRLICGYIAVLMAGGGAVCYGITAWFLRHRLNLE